MSRPRSRLSTRGLSTTAESRGSDIDEQRANNVPDCPPGARLVPLTQGHFAIVDEADYDRVAPFNWCLSAKRGRLRKYARRTIRVGGRKIDETLHRFLFPECPPGLLRDHINGNGLDNRRCNIRFCTFAQNTRNRPKPRNTSCSFKGVCFIPDRRVYRAGITADGITYALGNYSTEVEAAKAYDSAAKHHHGAFARLNFPENEGASDALHVSQDERESVGCPYPGQVAS